MFIYVSIHPLTFQDFIINSALSVLSANFVLVYGYLIISRQWTLLSRDKQWHSRYQTRSKNWDDWSKDWDDSPLRSASLPPSSNTSLLTMGPSILLLAISHIDTRPAMVLVWGHFTARNAMFSMILKSENVNISLHVSNLQQEFYSVLFSQMKHLFLVKCRKTIIKFQQIYDENNLNKYN